VNALAERLTTAPVLNTQIRSLTKNDKGITAETIVYDPALPDQVKMQFENIYLIICLILLNFDLPCKVTLV